MSDEELKLTDYDTAMSFSFYAQLVGLAVTVFGLVMEKMGFFIGGGMILFISQILFLTLLQEQNKQMEELTRMLNKIGDMRL